MPDLPLSLIALFFSPFSSFLDFECGVCLINDDDDDIYHLQRKQRKHDRTGVKRMMTKRTYLSVPGTTVILDHSISHFSISSLLYCSNDDLPFARPNRPNDKTELNRIYYLNA